MKKKHNWVKVLGVIMVIILIIVIIINIIINSVSNNVGNINENEMSLVFNEYTVKEQNMEAFVKGTGEITSFNIKTLDIPSYSSIKEEYVKDGDIVKAKQKIMKISVDGYIQDITSPIEGMYFETENMGSKIYQIYDLNEIGLEMYVSQSDVASLALNQKAYVKITALNKEIEGTVSYISKLPTDGKFKVKIKIPYTEDIRFGYGASIKILVAQKENVLVIPYDALQMDNDNRYYLMKQEYKTDYYNNYINGSVIPESAKTYVDIGTITNSQVEIKSGIKSGDVILEWNW